MEELEGHYSMAAGGSLTNSLVDIARLAAASGDTMSVGIAGLLGEDTLGQFYSAQLRAAGVDIVSRPRAGTSTGTVMVFTTPDAARTMLSYPGTLEARTRRQRGRPPPLLLSRPA